LEKEERRQPPDRARQVNYRLRDWGISRQRYWAARSGHSLRKMWRRAGAEKDLPVTLAGGRHFSTGGQSVDITATWKQCRPARNAAATARARRDTMDTFVDSSWYSAFTDP